MHAPRFFSHGDDSLPRGFGRGKVDVGHFGQCISHGIVDRALTDFAALDMRDGNAKGQCNGSGRQHFIAIGNQQKQVRARPPRWSARLSVARPMVFAIPTSVSELSRHSILASILKPSFSIS